MRIAVLGTGAMGAGMARSLVRAGQTVTVWNRTASGAAPLAADGATVASTAAEAVDGADVVLTMLFDGSSVLAVMADAIGSVSPTAVWMQSSTVGLDGVARAAALARAAGVPFVDAPVLGTRAPAERGELVVLVAGGKDPVDQLAPVLDAVGSRTVRVGEQVGSASALKLACNAWVATLVAGTAQSLALAAGLGVDPTLFLEAIRGGPLDVAYAHLKAEQMLSGDYPVSFSVDGVRKDLDLIARAGRESGAIGDLVDALSDVFAQASHAGHAADDMAAVYAAFAPRPADPTA